MGDQTAHSRAFITKDISDDNLSPNITLILTTILKGFAESSKPVPRRTPPKTSPEKFKPPVKTLKPGRVLKPKKEPWNLNKHNPGKVLRVVLINQNPMEIFVEVNQKKMTRPKYWTDIRAKIAKNNNIYLKVDYARNVNKEIKKHNSFYSYALSKGTLLYETSCNIWVNEPHTPPDTVDAAVKQMGWFQEKIKYHTDKQHEFSKNGNYRRCGYQIRFSIEYAYNMILAIVGKHSYPETDIAFLRERAEAITSNLRQPWFHKDENYEVEFERVRHANKDTHQFRQYRMSEDEIKVISRSQKKLFKMANSLCEKAISNLNL